MNLHHTTLDYSISSYIIAYEISPQAWQLSPAPIRVHGPCRCGRRRDSPRRRTDPWGAHLLLWLVWVFVVSLVVLSVLLVLVLFLWLVLLVLWWLPAKANGSAGHTLWNAALSTATEHTDYTSNVITMAECHWGCAATRKMSIVPVSSDFKHGLLSSIRSLGCDGNLHSKLNQWNRGIRVASKNTS